MNMKNYLLLIFFILTNQIYTQTIELDLSFGVNGYSEAFSVSSGSPTDTAILNDGTFITGYRGGSFIRLKKIDQNGIIDNSFNSDVFYLGAGSFSLFRKLVLHNDKIIVAGMGKLSLTADYDLLIIRFNLDGSLDTTFGTNGYTMVSYGSNNDEPVEILNDTAGNTFIYSEHNYDYYFTKLDSNGVVDSSFGNNGILYTNTYSPGASNSNSDKPIYKVFLQNDGKFLFAGAKRNSSTNNFESFLERKLQDGTYDNSFGVNGELVFANTEHTSVRNFEYDYDNNSILVLHEFDNVNFTNDRVFLSKIQINDGSLILGFANNGITNQYQFSGAPRLGVRHISTLPDSKIIIAGTVSYTQNSTNILSQLFVFRCNSDGSLDASSGSTIFFTTEYPLTHPQAIRADFMPRLFNLNDGSFVLAYSGEGNLNYSYLAKFNGTTLGVDETQFDPLKTISVYPNPAENYVTIQRKLNSDMVFKYRFIDLIGRVSKIGISKFNEKIEINDILSGIYVIDIETEAGDKFLSKIIIE